MAINTSGAQSVAGKVVTAVLVVIVLGALASLFWSNLATVVGTFTDVNTTTGNTDADAILPVAGLITAFLGLFGFAGLIWSAVKMGKK